MELPPFQRIREQYFDDDAFKGLQNALMKNPEAGSVIQGTGGLRKARYGDENRNRGKRGGLRVIYYWRGAEDQFWLFTAYGKDEADDLTLTERKIRKARLDQEIKARSVG
ncbi:MAG: toxin [Noviherbaspirillum sp.]